MEVVRTLLKYHARVDVFDEVLFSLEFCLENSDRWEMGVCVCVWGRGGGGWVIGPGWECESVSHNILNNMNSFCSSGLLLVHKSATIENHNNNLTSSCVKMGLNWQKDTEISCS